MGNWQPEQPCHPGFCEESGELWESSWALGLTASTASDSSIRLGLLFRGIIFYLLHKVTVSLFSSILLLYTLIAHLYTVDISWSISAPGHRWVICCGQLHVVLAQQCSEDVWTQKKKTGMIQDEMLIYLTIYFMIFTWSSWSLAGGFISQPSFKGSVSTAISTGFPQPPHAEKAPKWSPSTSNGNGPSVRSQWCFIWKKNDMK